MVHALAPLHAVVDHDPESGVELLLLRHALRGEQEVTEERLVILRGFAQLGQAGADLGDDEEVRLGLRGDVAERQAEVVLVDDVRGDLLRDDLIEQRGLARVRQALEVRLQGGGLFVAGRGGHRGGPRARRSETANGGEGPRTKRDASEEGTRGDAHR